MYPVVFAHPFRTNTLTVRASVRVVVELPLLELTMESTVEPHYARVLPVQWHWAM